MSTYRGPLATEPQGVALCSKRPAPVSLWRALARELPQQVAIAGSVALLFTRAVAVSFAMAAVVFAVAFVFTCSVLLSQSRTMARWRSARAHLNAAAWIAAVDAKAARNVVR